MRGLTILAAATIAFGGTPSQGQQDLLVKLYNEAREAEASGNYEVATERYERIAALRPDMAEVYANLGNLYYVRGLQEKATLSFKKAIRLKPSLAAPHLFLGLLSLNARDLQHAASYLKDAERLDPANTLAPLYLGSTYYAQNRFDDAVAVLERATDIDSRNLDAWYYLSKAHSQLSKRYFEKLQAKHPSSFFTALARSHFYESGAQWEQAQEELRKAVATHDEDGQLQRRLEWLRKRAGGDLATPPPENAFAGSTRYLYSPPEGEQIRAAYGAERKRILGSLNGKSESPEDLYHAADSEQAMSFLSSLWVLQTDSNSYRSHELRAEALEAAGKTDEAIAEYRKALEVKPELQTVHFAIGNIYWRLGRNDEALAELTEELKINPANPQAHYECGDVLLSENKLDEAEKHFAAALKYSPEMTEAHLAMERIAAARGDTNGAIAHLKKAAELRPASSTPHYRLWLLYRKMGRTADAERERAEFEKLRQNERK